MQLGWFLFAAKVYETLVVASLAEILLYHVRYALTRGSHGIPFGALTAPYQLSNTLHLFDKPFAASLAARKKSKQQTGILLLTVVCFILAMLAG